MKITSPYDGFSRAPLRVLVAVVAALDLLALAAAVVLHPASGISHPLAPRALLALGGQPLYVVPVALVGLFALAEFARSPSRVAWGGLALVSLAVLTEAHAALVEGPMRIFFATGATLSGWLAGSTYARGLGYPRDDAAGRERLAEFGAVSGLAATYVGAAVSKLLASGFSWADANALRSVLFSQRGVPGHSPFDAYAWAIASHAWLAFGLSLATLVIQLGALLYPHSPRTRAVIGTLLLSFHLNVWFLTPILFPEAMVLLVAFSYPWPRWLRRKWGRWPEAPPDYVATRFRLRLATVVASLGIVCLAVALAASPLRAYTALHHRRPSFGNPGAASSSDARSFVDRLAVGDDVAGFRVDAVWATGEGALGVLVSRDGTHFEVDVVPRGARSVPPPFQTGVYDLFYEHVARAEVTPETCRAVLAAIAGRLKAPPPVTAGPVPSDAPVP